MPKKTKTSDATDASSSDLTPFINPTYVKTIDNLGIHYTNDFYLAMFLSLDRPVISPILKLIAPSDSIPIISVNGEPCKLGIGQQGMHWSSFSILTMV